MELTEDQIEQCELNNWDKQAVEAYFEAGMGDDDLSDFEEAYQGEFSSDEAFAKYMAEETGPEISDAWPLYCIDWEYAARELMMDYTEQGGYYFRNL